MSRLRGWRTAALSLLVLAAGCSDGGPMQPEPQYSLDLLSFEATVDVSRVARYRTSAQLYHASESAWIGPEGGTLRLMDFELVVPRGAVLLPTKFRIKLPTDPKKLQHALAEFQPHLVTFLKPVMLRMPYRGTTAEGLTPSVIWWYGTGWVRYPTTLLPDGRLETTTNHFSFFGTELLAPGITPVGG
jgi:hypothetical protein